MSIETTYLRSRILDAKSNLNEIREGLTFGDPTYIGVVAAIEILTDALAKAPPELKGAREAVKKVVREIISMASHSPGEADEWVDRIMREVQPTESPTGWDEAQASLLAAKGVLARESVKCGFQLPEPLAEIARHLHNVEFHLAGAKPGSGTTPVSLVSPAPGRTWMHAFRQDAEPWAIYFGTYEEMAALHNCRQWNWTQCYLGPVIYGEHGLPGDAPTSEPQAQPIPPEAGTT